MRQTRKKTRKGPVRKANDCISVLVLCAQRKAGAGGIHKSCEEDVFSFSRFASNLGIARTCNPFPLMAFSFIARWTQWLNITQPLSSPAWAAIEDARRPAGPPLHGRLAPRRRGGVAGAGARG